MDEFADELVEVAEPVFARRGVTVALTPTELKALRDLAASRGLNEAALVREWVREKLHH